MMRKEEKTAIIEQFATHPGDTGSPEVQIAVLTSRINDLTEHLRGGKPLTEQPLMDAVLIEHERVMTAIEALD